MYYPSQQKGRQVIHVNNNEPQDVSSTMRGSYIARCRGRGLGRSRASTDSHLQSQISDPTINPHSNHQSKSRSS
ncbi:hypothetical protein N657DRAFT_647696 [Parathielavia appendiculata]|uniref:Uncharacterized protein n=1 Tax=Parathielavia appendiculata TaxID=2587402 RepID=A0AAN6TW04_9PEZI|nr:hypothetical protein N657DRAFT_647696 [Parathielavia appendiculata]